MIIWFFGFVLLSVLAALAVIDFKTMILPNMLTFPLIFIGLLFAYWQNALLAGVIGTAVGYAGLVALELAYKRLRGIDGIGRGDAKLLAAGGAWCGWYGLSFILLIASFSGLIHALILSKSGADPKNQKLPFGPHLALGIFLTWLALFVLR
ncbi:MAG: prepilin peptidase [Robiginitomaculum sp.]|nr:prepilin peptidase [Robiginitomaculum sp.]